MAMHSRLQFVPDPAAPSIVRDLGLVGELFRDDLVGKDEWWIPDLSRKLGVIPQKVHYWVKQMWVHSRRSCPIVTEWRETSTIPQVTKHHLLNQPPSQESASATSPCRCGHRASAPANRSCNCTSCSRSSPRASASPC